jgi:hypothetical protein
MSADDLHLLIPFFAMDPSEAVTRSVEQSLAAVLGVHQVTVDWEARLIRLTVQAEYPSPEQLRAVIHAHGWRTGLVERA